MMLNHDVYDKFEFAGRSCLLAGVGHWDGTIESIHYRRELDIVCPSCYIDVELCKLYH